MKILHTADFHISCLKPMLGNAISMQRALRSMKALYKVVVTEKPDVLVIAGDVFDSTSPNSFELSLFTTFLIHSLKRGVEVLLLPGNHDSESEAGNTGINYLKPIQKAFSNFHLCLKEPLSVTIQDYCFVLFPWGNLPDDYHNSLFTVKNRIAVMHIPLSGAKISADNRLLTQGFSAGTAKEMVKKFDLNYLLLGDIHEYQKITENIMYCGSLIQTAFGQGEEKGVILIDTDTQVSKFVDLHVRPKLLTVTDVKDVNDVDIYRLKLSSADGAFDIINNLPTNVVKHTIPSKAVSDRLKYTDRKVGFEINLEPVIEKLLEKQAIKEPKKYMDFLCRTVGSANLILP